MRKRGSTGQVAAARQLHRLVPALWASLSLCFFGAIAGCSGTAPRTLILGDGPVSDSALLSAHLPEAGRNITPFLLEEDQYTSRYLVWVRDREAPHVHAKHDLIVILLRGQGTLWRGGREIPMAVGDVSVIPAGIPHYFVNTGSNPSAAFAVYSPRHDGSDVVPAQ